MKKSLYFLTITAFLFLVIVPLFSVVVGSFANNGDVSFKNYFQIFNYKNFSLLLKTVGIAFCVSIISTLNGGFFAFVLTKTDLPLKNLFKLVLLIPLFLSPYILAVSWVDFFIISGIEKNFIYSPAGVVFLLSIIFSPLSMIIVSSGLSNLSSRYEEAGLIVTTHQKVIFKIILPLIKPALISSFILVFILSVSEFSVPAFLSVNVFTTEIFTQFSAFYNYGSAVANSMVLVLICVSLLMAERFYLAEASFLSIGTKSHTVKIVNLKNNFKCFFLFITTVYVFISVFIPVIVLSAQAFKESTEAFRQATVLLVPAIFNSLLYAAIGALLLVFFGFVFAYISEREKIKFINLILLITFGIPSTVLGIGLIKFFNTQALNFIYSGFWIIIFGYLGRFIFIAERLIANSIRQVPVSFEESAELMGAGFFLRIRKILSPLISNGLFGAFLISFIFCLGELGTTILVYPPGTSVMPIKVFTIMANAPQSLTSSMCLFVLIITTLSLSILFAGQKVLSKQQG